MCPFSQADLLIGMSEKKWESFFLKSLNKIPLNKSSTHFQWVSALHMFIFNVPFHLISPVKYPTMVTEKIIDDEKRIDRAAYVLKAVAHPLRIKIIQMLNENAELNVSAIYKNLNAEQSLISHHLINMRDKGILDIRRSGKNIYYFLIDSAVADIIDCIYKSKLMH